MRSTDDNPTAIVRELALGDRAAADRLFQLVYDELRGLAARYLRRGRRGHTLQTTALVHEAYLRLVGQRNVSWQGRAHFLAVAALAMRQHLMNYARERQAAKRGGGWQKLTLSVAAEAPLELDVDVLALHEALEKLARLNERHSQVVVARFLGGLTVKETAHVLGVSERSVKSDWRMARAWLARELRVDEPMRRACP